MILEFDMDLVDNMCDEGNSMVFDITLDKGDAVLGPAYL